MITIVITLRHSWGKMGCRSAGMGPKNGGRGFTSNGENMRSILSRKVLSPHAGYARPEYRMRVTHHGAPEPFKNGVAVEDDFPALCHVRDL
jgi:hypothetical protein